MEGYRPPFIDGDKPEEKPNPISTQSWLVSLWLKRQVGIPDHLCTAERVGTVMLASGYLVEALQWYVAAKKKQWDEEEKKNGAADHAGS